MSQEDTSVDDLLNALNTSNDVLKRLALGNQFYNSLNFEDLKDTEEFKKDIINARKHQQHLTHIARNEIEREQLNALLQESAFNLNNDEVSYYKSVKRIKDDTHEKLGEQIKKTRSELKKKLDNDTEKLIEEKELQLSEYRNQFEENEKIRAQVEREEIKMRKDWKKKVSSSHTDFGPNQYGPQGSVYRSPSQSSSPRTAPSSGRKKLVKSNSPRIQDDIDGTISSPRNDILLLMTVDIGDGRVDSIKVHHHTVDFEKLAKDFQLKHRLGEQVIKPLTEHIRSNVEALLKEQQKQLEEGLLNDIRGRKSLGKKQSNYSQVSFNKMHNE